VQKEFVPEGKTVNAEFYNGVKDCLLKCIQRIRPDAFCSRDFFLLHDNAPAHKAASVCQFLIQKNVTTLYHPLYSPDLSPPDSFLFPKLKMKLKGLHFADIAEIQEAVTDELKKVQKETVHKLYDRTKACTYVNGAYFEYKKSYVSSSCVVDFKRKSFLKLLDRTVYTK
jgi:transposase